MSTIQTGDVYVALGSSFAAGPGIPGRVPGSPRRAGRSTGNYAHLVAERQGLTLRDATFSGATTSDILSRRSEDSPAQIDSVDGTTKLVTLTGGGNDIGYLPGLTLSSLPAVATRLPAVRRRLDRIRDATVTEALITRLERSLDDIVGEIRMRAPDSTVLLVDYLTILPTDGSISTAPLPSEMADWGRRIASRLTATTRRVAERGAAVFVPAGEVSMAHHAWAAIPWTRRFHYSLRGGAAYHPNAAGMAAVARMVGEALPER
ncbi:MAG TPA: SGNH/GDSL hydrolase family protein [Lacisediminihabitans sp.]|uniref:SGNH/GDSL hydrolase family protein n=1 Tax=Lacisediminihabitans sp. TaxID=2787631 RepID=UPI002ED90DBF